MAKGGARILIVGAGIGGMTLAAFLSRVGHSVVIVEKAAELRPVGAGIVLHPNSMKVLAMLGLDGDVKASGSVLRQAVMSDEAGNTLSTFDWSSDPRRVTVGIHRAALHEILARAAAGADLRLGATITDIRDLPGGVEVEMPGGPRERFDLVVGADGIHSQVRESVFGHHELRHSGQAAWRVVVTPRVPFPASEMGEVLGHGIRAGYVSIGGGRVYAFFVAIAGRNDPALRSLTIDALREKFRALEGRPAAVLDALEEGTPLIFNDLEDVFLEQWHKGHVALLGDAAHAMTPNLGQGAAMAIEDAKALEYALDTNDSIGTALTSYQRLRRERVRTVHQTSWNAGRVAQWSSAPATAFRKILYRLVPASASKRQLDALLDGGDEVRTFLSHRPDLPPLGKASRDLVRFLVKMALVDGRIDDRERAFIQAAFHEVGEHVSPSDLDTLAAEVANVSVTEVAKVFEASPSDVKRKVVSLGYALALANDHVVTRERRALDETRRLFGIEREEYERILAEEIARV
jgi:2-polyprenyl-6-methoxyphenol hydroxylase-like FAD-dependent oxidoreductase